MRVSDFNNPFLQRVISKVYRQRENCLILTTGKVQKGKTTVNMTLAKKLDPTFTMKRCVWLPEDFSNMLVTQKLRRGHAIMFEEIGTEAGGIPRRKWYDFNNFIVNDVLQTFGFEGLIVFFSVPSMNYIDSNALKLMDYKIEAVKKDMRNKVNYVKIFELQYNDTLDRIYYHRIRDKKGHSIKFFKIKRTDDKEFLKEFFAEERKYKEWIQTQAASRIKIKMAVKKSVDDNKIVEELVKDFNDGRTYWKQWQGRWVVIGGVVEKEFGIGNTMFRRVRDRAYSKVDRSIDDDQGFNSSSSVSS